MQRYDERNNHISTYTGNTRGSRKRADSPWTGARGSLGKAISPAAAPAAVQAKASGVTPVKLSPDLSPEEEEFHSPREGLASGEFIEGQVTEVHDSEFEETGAPDVGASGETTEQQGGNTSPMTPPAAHAQTMLNHRPLNSTSSDDSNDDRVDEGTRRAEGRQRARKPQSARKADQMHAISQRKGNSQGRAQVTQTGLTISRQQRAARR